MQNLWLLPAVESFFHGTKTKLQQLLKSVSKPLLDTRSEIERNVADLGVVTKITVPVIVKNLMTKSSSTLWSQIVKIFVSTFKVEIQSSYINYNNGVQNR